MSHEPVRSDDDFLVFGAPAIERPEIDEVVDSLEDAWPGTGPKTQQFAADFRDYIDADHAIPVNSCTAALHLSLVSLDLDPDDEVITTPLTFCSTVNTIVHAGATPVLAGIDPETMNIDPEAVEAAVTDDTAAILPVHFAGRPCDMEALQAIADEHDLAIIEDAAHAIETEFDGQSAGTFGDFGCFSFYATKNVCTGEGGMIVTSSEDQANELERLSLHGMSQDAWKRYSSDGFSHYDVVVPGYKYNMMDLQAALGIHQLERVEDNWERRHKIWNRYQAAFEDLPIETPAPVADNHRHAFHLYTVLIDEDRAGLTRNEFLDDLQAENIGSGVHYMSIPEHRYYRQTYEWSPDDFPHAKRIGRQTASLPLAPNLTEDDVDDVIEAVHRVLD